MSYDIICRMRNVRDCWCTEGGPNQCNHQFGMAQDIADDYILDQQGFEPRETSSDCCFCEPGELCGHL